MSVSRAIVRPVRTATTYGLVQRRLASHSAHDSHHHDGHESAEYPKEGFSTPLWRNVALFAVGFIGLVKFLPENALSGGRWKDIDDAPWLTRVLAHNAPSKEEWTKVNDRNVERAEQFSEGIRLQQGAKREAIVRYRYPLKFEQVSAHRVPVGGMPDMSDPVIKP